MPMKKPPLQRTDLLDTSIAAHRRLIALLREMTPEERIRRTFEMMESARRLRELGKAYERPSDRSDL
jgi:hypothetical protein